MFSRFAAAARALGRLGLGLHLRGRGLLAAQAARLDSLSPLAVLGRGYALVRRSEDGAIVRRAGTILSRSAVIRAIGMGKLRTKSAVGI